jgi:ribonuclease BN (tRNA processing enzyme)
VIWNHKGILVDPGFDFVQIFERELRSIEDVDLVVVSHDHPDHCDGVSDLLTLLHEVNESRKTPHIIHFAVSPGTYSKYQSLFRRTDIKKHVTKLVPDSKFNLLPEITVSTIRNKHKEICQKGDGLGLRFSLASGPKIYALGITSDTGYHSRLSKFYDGVDTLIVHIGTLEKPHSRGLLANHLGFRGIVRTLRGMSSPPALTLVSEWGEELWGMRKEIAEHLENHVGNTHVLPADLSLTLLIPQDEIYVEEDEIYVPSKDVFVSDDYGDRLRYKAR